MSVEFEKEFVVNDGILTLGVIRSDDIGKWVFDTKGGSVFIRSYQLQAIADKLDELNGAKALAEGE